MNGLLDGADANCETLRVIASSGKFGSIGGNIERDLLARLHKHLGIPFAPMAVAVNAVDARTSSTKVTDAFIINPHEAYQHLYEVAGDRSVFFSRMGTPEEWAVFWTAVAEEQWFLDHPLRREILANPFTYTPVLLHADDAQQTKRVGKTMRVASWFSACAHNKEPLKSKIPMFVTGNDDVFRSTVEFALYEAAAWSLNSASTGYNPEHGVYREPLAKIHQAKSGTPLASGFKLAFAGTVGDWKEFAEDFHVPHHYNTEEICMDCFACKSGTMFSYANASMDAPWSHSSRDVPYRIPFDRLPVHPQLDLTRPGM